MLVLALIALGIVAAVWWPWHREQRIIDQFQGPYLRVQVSPGYKYVGPLWLDRFFDRRSLMWLHRIDALNFFKSRWPDDSAPFPDLQPLQHCTGIYFDHMTVDDPLYSRRIARCPALTQLNLRRCEISGGALRGLDGHAALQEIHIVSCDGPPDVLELPAVPSLHTLKINQARFAGIDPRAAPNLRRLEAKNCRITDEGLSRLAGAPRLEVVMIPRHTIGLTDAGIDHLLQLPSLRHLDLRFQRDLTRPALERLAPLPRLQTVNVFGTQAEDELDQLREALPQAKSTYSP